VSLECGCDDGEGFVELDVDDMSRAPNTIICRECGHLIEPGADYYRVRSWKFGDWIPDSVTPWIDDGDEIEIGIREVCETCGDLAINLLERGFCWYFGQLRNDINTLHQLETRQ